MPIAQIVQRSLLALLACGVLSACGDAEKPAGGPVSQAPSEAVESTPPPSPTDTENAAGVPPVSPAPPAARADTSLTPDLHARFTRGITLEEAQALTPIPAVRVGGDTKDTALYRWTDTAGAYFTARFEANILTTKSSLGVQRAAGSTGPASASGEIDVNTMPVAQIAPGVYIPLERAVTSATDQPLGTPELPAVPQEPAPPQGKLPPAAAATPAGPTIAIAGATRRTREAVEKKSSYHPHATLPEFSRSLEEGSFEIRFLNPSASPVTVGLRQNKLGRNVTVPPGGKASAKVNRGIYQLFFLRESDPNTLYEAKNITLDGFENTDVEVTLDPENVEVRLIDYSKPDN